MYIMQTILVTGAAGFIGSNLVLELLRSLSPVQIIGLDNMNDYYDVSIKEYRLEQITASAAEHSESQWTFIKGNLADKALIDKIFADYQPEIVVNLAAQAGVRYSITNPDAYIESNLIGFYNILEACRHSYDNGSKGVEHLVYASSSSVYGSNKKVPYSTDDKVDNPVSLYAATKNPTSFWHMPTVSCTIFLQPDYAFSLYMALQDAQIWPTLASPISCWQAKLSKSLTMAIASAILLILMI